MRDRIKVILVALVLGALFVGCMVDTVNLSHDRQKVEECAYRKVADGRDVETARYLCKREVRS